MLYKERVDKVLVNRGLAENCHKAQALILAGMVFTGDKRVEKPGQMIMPEQDLTLKEKPPFVSRGGLKLEEALDAFNLVVEGKVAADLGSSTGGFTDCMIQRGAKKVFALDVDTRQFDWRLSQNPRITLIKKNVRYLEKSDFYEDLDLITMDLSFISVLTVLPAVRKVLNRADLVSLIKPQFEVGRHQVGKKGIVRDPVLHQDVLERIIDEARYLGFKAKGVIKTSIRGQKGNQEFFILWTLMNTDPYTLDIQSMIKEAVWSEKHK
ncbi:MAG: TlyA family RNA methyltransferase [Candidatus Aminicenantes bacterium]|nr:TlyA family RNA methyltransferase [Candidatus Aminicenantes bacterium]